MKINKNNIIQKLNTTNIKKTKEKITKTIKEAPKGVRNAALTAALVLTVLGIGKCSSDHNTSITETVINPVDVSERDNYIEKSERTFYKVVSGDNPEKIAKKFNISTRRLLNENGMKTGTIIYPGDSLLIPESQTAVNINGIEDISKLTGFSKDFLNELENMESKKSELYQDKNGNWTVGIGHLIKNEEEMKKYQGRTLEDKEIYTILAQDLLDIDLDFQSALKEDSYNAIPQCIKESCTDLMFNKGQGAIINNEKIMDGLLNNNYEKVISNLTQDYSVKTAKDGTKKQIPASGLSKRRLYNIAHASQYFQGNIPSSVKESAKKVYDRGLVYMEQEKNRGEINAAAYENVRAEYKDLAYQWFDGKIGEKLENKSSSNKAKTETKTEEVKPEQSTNSSQSQVNHATVPKDKANVKIHIDGGKLTTWTYEKLYKDWEKTAERSKRPFKRPLPEIDANGNIVASVKVLEPTGKGAFNGKTIIVNPGHGGCMNHVEDSGKLNVNFDPGTSNAIMSKKNKNIETNEFIGNEGKALEEWFVNMKISDNLSDKIREQGGKVIYVQGSVYSAQNAIRDLVKKNKIDMLVSLHSNSSVGRGIYVFGNDRGGIDIADQNLAKKIEEKMNQHNWFNGIVKQDEKSLGVLSKDRYTTLDIPAVLIETGNLKDKTDVANLNSSQFKEYMVDAIINGMKDYK